VAWYAAKIAAPMGESPSQKGLKMPNTVATYGWETLAPPEGGRRLLDRDEQFQVSAKVRTHGHYKGWLFVKMWSKETGWSHLAFDTEHTLVAQGYGAKEKDSYADLRRVLAHKNVAAARADLS
jgi:hypothetical protein